MVIIGVIGPPGVGKTAFAAALAAVLSDRSNVVLASLDDHCPALGAWEPARKELKSFKEIIDKEGSTNAEYILKTLNVSSYSDRVCLYGLTKNDLRGANNINGRLIKEIMSCVSDDIAAQYFVVDGTNYGDAMTSYAVDQADILIRILPADRTGGLFYRSDMIPATTKTTQQRLNLIYRRALYDPMDAVVKENGIAVYADIPYTEECHHKLVDGRLISRYGAREYRSVVERVVAYIKNNRGTR